jgi:hypothetical protein
MRMVVGLCGVLVACGGSDGVRPGDPSIAGELHERFDQTGCTGLDDFELAGVWHQNLVFDDGDFPGYSVVRWEDGNGRWQAFHQGTAPRKSRFDGDEAYLETNGVRTSGSTFRYAYFFCRAEGPDRLVGRYLVCNTPVGEEELCYFADVTSQRVARAEGESDAEGLSLVGELGFPDGAAYISVNVRVQDGLAYVARYNDGLRIADVSDPAHPVARGRAPTTTPSEIWNDVKLVTAGDRRYALMASNERGVVVVDVTNPDAPTTATVFPDPARYQAVEVNVHTLAVETRDGHVYAHLANVTTSGLETWDVTEPTQPVFVSEYIDPAVATNPEVFVHDLSVEDGVVYLCYWAGGLVVVDTKPAVPVVLGAYDDYTRRTTHSVWTTTAGGRKIAVIGDEDYGAHLRVIDVDPLSATFMTKLGELPLREHISVHNIMAFGDTAYVAWYQDGVRLVDLSDPTAPTFSGHFNTWDGPGDSFFEGAVGLDVDLAAQLVYVADAERGLLVVRLP